jgi:hypothetical protein
MVDHAEKPSAYADKKTLGQKIGEKATCRARRQHRSLTKSAEKEVRRGQKRTPTPGRIGVFRSKLGTGDSSKPSLTHSL